MVAKRVDLTYDAAGRMTTLTRYSNLAGTTTVLTSIYGYDNADRLVTLTHQTGGATVRVKYVDTLDNAGRATQEVRTWNTGAATDTVTYGYTNNDQLTSVTHTNGSFANESFSYDTNGNRTGTTGTDNRLTTDGTYNYGYDNEGNLTTRNKISDSSQTIYKYDYHNRLTEVDSKPAVGATVVLATYTYDAQDRRIGRTEGGTTTATLYDGNAPVLDFLNGSSTPGARYLQGRGAAVDQVLARETSGSTVAWYLADRLGTIRDIVDNTGAIIDHVDYSAYGKVLSESAPTAGDRLTGFAGLERDTATGLNLAVLRAQDPGTGRWLSEDPSGLGAGDTNLSRYVDNQPTMSKDPLGLFGITINPGYGPLIVPRDRHYPEPEPTPLPRPAPPSPRPPITDDELRSMADEKDREFRRWLRSMADEMNREFRRLRLPEPQMQYGVIPFPEAFCALRFSWPPGLASTANLAKGTTLARNLPEQLAIEEAMANPAAGARLPFVMSDPMWPAAAGWVKMQWCTKYRIIVHYVYNTVTGAIDDFKIVLPGPRP